MKGLTCEPSFFFFFFLLNTSIKNPLALTKKNKTKHYNRLLIEMSANLQDTGTDDFVSITEMGRELEKGLSEIVSKCELQPLSINKFFQKTIKQHSIYICFFPVDI